MARSVNKVILLGRVGKDPELKYTSNGNAFCRFSIATSDQWTDKNTHEKQEATEWHNCVAWGKTGELINQYVVKGAQLYVEGSIHTRDWQDQQGNKRRSTEIKVDDFTLCGGRGNGGGSSREAGDEASSTDNVPDAYKDRVAAEAKAITDDDIPF